MIKHKALHLGLLTLGLGMAPVAMAINYPGYYVGVQAGQSDSDYSKSYFGAGSAGSVDTDGFAGRVYGGYSYNENFALELGYARFSDTDFRLSNGTRGEIDEQAVDLVVRVNLPLSYGFDAYAKGGAIYRDSDIDSSLKRSPLNTRGRSDDSEWSWTYGLGLGYNISDNFMVDASWSRAESTSDLRDMDFLAVGLTFRFA